VTGFWLAMGVLPAAILALALALATGDRERRRKGH
jgi:hypothetical protein